VYVEERGEVPSDLYLNARKLYMKLEVKRTFSNV